MIINRYLVRSILLGSLGALLVLVSLGLFFILVGQLDKVGEGDYGLLQMIEYVALRTPGKVVEFLPLAVLLGSILSLGARAGNSEIIAMQASGVSLARMLASVVQAALIMAAVGFFLADRVVPHSETRAGDIKNLRLEKTTALRANESLWIKDETRVLHIEQLLPNGVARNIEIFQLDEQGRLASITRAESALPNKNGWELQQVEKSEIGENSQTQNFERLAYGGNLSHQLLEVLMIEPRQMSIGNLSAYLKFLSENKLDSKLERLVYWQKIFAPLTVLVMCLLAFPFVLGAQRQSNNGHRLLLGIVLGLAFVVLDQLLVQLGNQFGFSPLLIALSPGMIFLALAIHLLLKKKSQGGKRRARRLTAQ